MNEWPQFNAVDIAALAVVAWGVLQGLRRGLSGELARVSSTIIIVWLGWRYYRPLGDRLLEVSRLDAGQSRAVAFMAILVGGLLGTILLRILLKQIMEFTFKGKLERIGGLFAGFIRSGLITVTVVFLMGLWPGGYIHHVFAEGSLLGRHLQAWIPPAYEELNARYPELPPLPVVGKDQPEPRTDEPLPDITPEPLDEE